MTYISIEYEPNLELKIFKIISKDNLSMWYVCG